MSCRHTGYSNTMDPCSYCEGEAVEREAALARASLEVEVQDLDDEDALLWKDLFRAIEQHFNGDIQLAIDKLSTGASVFEWQLRSKLKRAQAQAEVAESARQQLFRESLRSIKALTTGMDPKA